MSQASCTREEFLEKVQAIALNQKEIEAEIESQKQIDEAREKITHEQPSPQKPVVQAVSKRVAKKEVVLGKLRKWFK